MAEPSGAEGRGLSASEIAAIRERLEAATPGPWVAYLGPNTDLWAVDQRNGPIVCGNLGPNGNRYSAGNAAFIAHARTDVPALLAELERGAAREAALREALEFYADPDTYYGIAFLPDPPCGELMDDFEHLDPRVGSKPGKRAREALAVGSSEGVGDGG